MPEPRLRKARSILADAAVIIGPAGVLVGLAAYGLLDNVAFLSAPVIGPFGVGVLLFAGGIVLNRRRLWQRITQRRFLAGVNVWAMTVLCALALLIANTIVAMTPRTQAWFIDCTRDRLFTLSEKTRNILRGLNDDVAITVLMGDGKVTFRDRGEVEISQRLKDMVRLYPAVSGRVTSSVLDFYRENLRVETLAHRIEADAEPNTIIIECGDRHTKIPFFELVDLPDADAGESLPGFLGEERISAAILKVTETTPTRVYFLTGHGESAVAGPSDKALNEFAEELRRDNCRIESLNLLQRRAVPADCDLLIVAGPTAPFEKEEVEILRDYLGKDGRLFVLVRPKAMRGDLGRLDELLAEYNVQVAPAQVVIEVYQGVGDLRVIAEDFTAHPITEGLRNINCLLQNVCPVGPVIPEPEPTTSGLAPTLRSPYQVTPLLHSSPRSWGETNLAAKTKFEESRDRKGPLPLAVAVEQRPPRKADSSVPHAGDGPRLVVVGCVRVAADGDFSRYVGNRTFVMNCVSWLVHAEEKLGIPPQRPERRQLTQSPKAWRAVFFITVLGMPAIVVLLGSAVWWVRRRP